MTQGTLKGMMLHVNDVLVDRVIETAAAIQQIPAPTFAEAERAAFVHKLFQGEDMADVSKDGMGNVHARLPGAGTGLPLVVSAHLDTVFPAGTDLTLRREEGKLCGAGIGDNSLGVAGLFGLVWGLRESGTRLPGDVWLVANVREEGLGDLGGMQAVVERYGTQVQAYVVLEGMALGQVYHRGTGVRRYRVTLRTSGGHSWVDYGRPSAIHELAELVVRLKHIPLPVQPRTTLNVGMISGGTSVNTIAPDACIDLDLRSEHPTALAELVAQVEALVDGAGRGGTHYVHPTLEIIGNRPPGGIAVEHPLVRLAVRSLEALGIKPILNSGSTDANIPLSRGIPAITLGLTTGGGAHTVNEHIFTRPIGQGLNMLMAVVRGVWGN